MSLYYRPMVHDGSDRPANAVTVAGGWCWCEEVQVIERGKARRLVDVHDLPPAVFQRLTARRAPIAGLSMGQPQLMGILNVTPDSFSDGGDFSGEAAATAHAEAMHADGASIIDIGGESTRPGATVVPDDEEIKRTAPVIAAIARLGAVISIDTRKASVANVAIAAGAGLVNDVAAFTHDPALAEVAAQAGLPVCLMHAQGDPETMQADPRYDDVLLDVYDFLEARVAVAEEAGISRDRIIVDPGIGFGKTVEHNLTLLRGLSLFHALGCPILLGASRKRFIGTLGHAPEAKDRLGGSVSVALHGVRQGVQIIRAHDTFATKQAIDLYLAMIGATGHDE